MFNTKLSDLDDFLAPSQDWVVQLMTSKPADQAKKAEKGSVQIELESDWQEQSMTDGIRPDLIKKTKDNVATISLSDCLACNGCVTTAETMLIQQHSIDKVEELLANADKEPCVFSISQQSLYSLWVLYETEPSKLFRVIAQVLGSFGAAKTYDLSLSTQFVLSECYNEFVEKYTKSEKYQILKECLDKLKDKTDEEIERETKEIKKTIAKINSTPVLCSECPGWVWYAEKVVGDTALPYMSLVKSPQQIQGHLIKKFANKKLFTSDESQEPPTNVMHICVMPCYDKKLEAVRPAGQIPSDDISENSTINEVDAVIATHELADLFTKKGIDIKGLLASLEEQEQTYSENENFDKDLTDLCREAINSPYYSPHNQTQTSNGYSEFLFRKAAKELFDVDLTSKELEYKQCRNKDFNEVTLEIHGIPVMKFALAYGFRNIQNIVRNIKRKKWAYDYVEIMACPGGWLNGGGQIKPKDMGMSPADLLENLKGIQMQSLELIDHRSLSGLVALYNDIDPEKLKEMIKTAFTVIKTETSVANLKW